MHLLVFKMNKLFVFSIIQMILSIENVTFLSSPPGYWKQLITIRAFSERVEGGMEHWNGSILDAYVLLSCPHAAESYNHRCSNESHSQSVTQTLCCSSRQSTAAEILSSLRRFPAAFKRVSNSVHDVHLCSYNKSNSTWDGRAKSIHTQTNEWYHQKVEAKTTPVQFICNVQLEDIGNTLDASHQI